MQAKDFMTTGVECISPGMSVRDAALRMKSLDVGFLPVCENDRLVGTLTDRDLALRVIADGRDAEDCKARDIMTRDVFWCYEEQPSDEVAEYMADKEIRRLLVLDQDKRLVGVISIGDLAKSGEERKAGEAIREIVEAPPTQAA
jgi:CBS domain-containing protein